jgi:adenine-specific DNA-methyltransferase
MELLDFGIDKVESGILVRSLKLQNEYEADTTADQRKQRGQFFTPPAIARFMAEMFSTFPKDFCLLDPGAGTGILAAAVCERLLKLRSPRNLQIHLYENDKNVLEKLRLNMKLCQQKFREVGHSMTFRIFEEDFILSQAPGFSPQPSLFNKSIPAPLYHAVIANPPYFKINKDSKYARLMSHVVHGQPNIYALFLALSMELLQPNGEMVAITPRSFCNGLYFREFRHWVFNKASLTHVHLFESRNKTFREASVLQESVITKTRRLGKPSPEITISLTHERDFQNGVSTQTLNKDIVIDNSCGDMLICLPETAWDAKILEYAELWPSRFTDLGLRISTGPVVMFRAKKFLVDHQNAMEDVVPLVSAHNIRPFITTWPVRKKNWPLAFLDAPASAKHLVRNRNYVFLKRFTSKEERRRLVAGCSFVSDWEFPRLALENHINYVYHCTRELTKIEVYGIAAVLNSILLDRYFRTFSGNTQVNATEIRTMKFPDLNAIAAIGSRISRKHSIEATDSEQIVLETLGVNGSLEHHLMENYH